MAKAITTCKGFETVMCAPAAVLGRQCVWLCGYPAYDQSEITALAAATLALEMLYIQAAKKGE